MPESGTSGRIREWAAIGRKLCRNPVRREELGTGSDQKKVVPESGTSGRIREQTAIGRKLYRNPVRREELATGSDQKKVVPESGTSGRDPGNGQQSEESCTGIRYAERNWQQEVTRRKLYRNPVRQVGSGNRQRSEESCTGIRYVR